MKNGFDRRNFLKLASTCFITAGIPVNALAQPSTASLVSFPQGIASGDPQTDSVILWTRAQEKDASAIDLIVQVSEETRFARVLVEEKLSAIQGEDFTVRAHISGLQPGRHYYYRFLASHGGSTVIGRTMTAPDPDNTQAVNIAFASCQNYEQGYFGAWGRMLTEDTLKPAEDQIQFVLHLGDFIYERYSYDQKDGERTVRKLPAYPDGVGNGRHYWAHSLADYRHLYKTYLSDPQLQAARARWPFICTWDDHEFSNNSVQYFSTYTAVPKAEPERKAAANQAWFEFIPARVENDPKALSIYRQLRWGKQIDLLVTDLRSYRSVPPVPDEVEQAVGNLLPVELLEALDAGKAYKGGQPPQYIQVGDSSYPNTSRELKPGSMLGPQQKQWFKQKLKDSNANWKVWANALPMVSLRLDLDQLPFNRLHKSVLGQDSWSGYPGERNEIMTFVADNKIGNVVSLSGDHHTQAAGSLAIDPDTENPRFAAVDFNVTGISSTPQFNDVLRRGQKDNPDLLQLVAEERDGELKETWNMSFTHGVLSSLAYHHLGMESVADWLGPNKANPGLSYVDSNSNGYGLARFDSQACQVQLITIDAPINNNDVAGPAIKHSANFQLASWSKSEQPQLKGPIFKGNAPFPFG